jgi:hypothetical protein
MNDHRIIRELIATIRDLRHDLEAVQVDIDSAQEQAAWQIEAARRAASQIASAAETERSSLAARVRTATYDLERARRSGDPWRLDQAARRLRDLA